VLLSPSIELGGVLETLIIISSRCIADTVDGAEHLMSKAFVTTQYQHARLAAPYWEGSQANIDVMMVIERAYPRTVGEQGWCRHTEAHAYD
jgi:hypothetical protein